LFADNKGNLSPVIYHHISVMGLGHLLTRFGVTYPEVSSEGGYKD